MLAAHGTTELPFNFLVICGTTTFLCAGLILNFYLFAQLMQTWNKFIHVKTATNSISQQFCEYMKYKGLPIETRSKIMAFFEFRFQRDFYHERRMQYFISETLRHRILMDLLRNHVTGTNLFTILPNDVLHKLLPRIKTEVYLEDDVIFRKGKLHETIHFIHNGTVAVYNLAGSEICHLEDGDSFGELCLLLEEKKLVSIVAIAPSEIFRIKKLHLLKVLEEFPTIKQNVLLDCRERFLRARTSYF
ncbi:potassium/sodium hyperpolarization-activated cyclic nucleotide-gated channel 3-like [Diorhabda carinulata]|uniref:potassium/sodium hyperpolarization-activated cyclic nucleotide-gated channel 3-like n=1 Tax=Diorhabda carinulata TaxID=1163345 RepID=UPI0025A24366|nr:potassium/sodium hyperpolarization-activated cyclic nucleotide-gated channel 3-like [Diorhabda carinulata]